MPDQVPPLDGLVASLSKNIDFVSDKVKTYMDLKVKREKVMAYLKDVRNKRNRMRRELVKNCRRLLSQHKATESEKASQEKKREHDMQELESFNKEADEILEDSKKLESPDGMPSKTVEVNTEKKRIGQDMRRSNLYLSSSDSESHSADRRHIMEEKTQVVAADGRKRKKPSSSMNGTKKPGPKRKPYLRSRV